MTKAPNKHIWNLVLVIYLLFGACILTFAMIIVYKKRWLSVKNYQNSPL